MSYSGGLSHTVYFSRTFLNKYISIKDNYKYFRNKPRQSKEEKKVIATFRFGNEEKANCLDRFGQHWMR